MRFLAQQAFQHSLFAAPEIILAMQREDIGHGQARRLLYLMVAVIKFAPQALGQPPSHRGLARPHQSNKRDGPGRIGGRRMIGFRRTVAVSGHERLSFTIQTNSYRDGTM